VSRTIARFSSSVVRSASRTCRTSDFATRQTTGVSASSSARTCGSSSTRTPALRVEPNATSWACRSLSSVRARAKNSVSLGLDEADADLVEQPGDGQLVGDGVAHALALGAVAQRGVEDVEVGVGGHDELLVGGRGPGKQKDPPGTGGLRAVGEGLRARR
jgi:hypothetical protein